MGSRSAHNAENAGSNPASAIDRFDAKWRLDPETGCHLWTARCDRLGYGRFKNEQREYVAHRFAYEFHVGPIPGGREIDHLCGNKGCVNPAHLEAVTHSENMKRWIARGGRPGWNLPVLQHLRPESPSSDSSRS